MSQCQRRVSSSCIHGTLLPLCDNSILTQPSHAVWSMASLPSEAGSLTRNSQFHMPCSVIDVLLGTSPIQGCWASALDEYRILGKHSPAGSQTREQAQSCKCILMQHPSEKKSRGQIEIHIPDSGEKHPHMLTLTLPLTLCLCELINPHGESRLVAFDTL